MTNNALTPAEAIEQAQSRIRTAINLALKSLQKETGLVASGVEVDIVRHSRDGVADGFIITKVELAFISPATTDAAYGTHWEGPKDR